MSGKRDLERQPGMPVTFTKRFRSRWTETMPNCGITSATLWRIRTITRELWGTFYRPQEYNQVNFFGVHAHVICIFFFRNVAAFPFGLFWKYCRWKLIQSLGQTKPTIWDVVFGRCGKFCRIIISLEPCRWGQLQIVAKLTRSGLCSISRDWMKTLARKTIFAP